MKSKTISLPTGRSVQAPGRVTGGTVGKVTTTTGVPGVNGPGDDLGKVAPAKAAPAGKG